MQRRSNSVTNGQRNDCTVRALMQVTGEDYRVVLLTLREAGRRENESFNLKAWIKAQGMVILGHRFEEVTTVSNWKGSYLLWQVGHVWSVVDGVVYDYEGSRATRWNRAWRVTRVANWTPSKTVRAITED